MAERGEQKSCQSGHDYVCSLGLRWTEIMNRGEIPSLGDVRPVVKMFVATRGPACAARAAVEEVAETWLAIFWQHSQHWSRSNLRIGMAA